MQRFCRRRPDRTARVGHSCTFLPIDSCAAGHFFWNQEAPLVPDYKPAALGRAAQHLGGNLFATSAASGYACALLSRRAAAAIKSRRGPQINCSWYGASRPQATLILARAADHCCLPNSSTAEEAADRASHATRSTCSAHARAPAGRIERHLPGNHQPGRASDIHRSSQTGRGQSDASRETTRHHPHDAPNPARNAGCLRRKVDHMGT